jgi:hypothetical protein
MVMAATASVWPWHCGPILYFHKNHASDSMYLKVVQHYAGYGVPNTDGTIAAAACSKDDKELNKQGLGCV